MASFVVSIGAPRPKFGGGIRTIAVDPFVMFYEVGSDDSVVVLRILHGRRDITVDLIRRR